MNMKISKESFYENSENSDISSISASDFVEDAEFPATLSSSSSSNGPLYELSEIMAQLPIKRGLSKHYEGKSRSFASLASVKSVEDLPKRAISFGGSEMKSCKSYGWGLDGHHNSRAFSPKATISKKGSSRVGFMSSSLAR
ncbi:uncharacterized protein LOC120114843 [Hibiscus syriacus]|uniref:uncharacterized protein LOC120114843 n=1 Tax=Hibiscus syriacus TaxID=106335 RepID=UPI0019243F43|nr:uncharacterized protein LOC120114843 [Hibiscus syriacus]